MEQYNKACEVGHDGEYYKEKTYLRPLNTKKLYAIKLKAYFFSSYGGLNTNRKHQVLDKNNKPIKGLYAAGEVTTGVHGSNRVGGNGLLDAFVFGRIAGENAAVGL